MDTIQFSDHVRRGDRVICGQGAAEPITLLQQLLEQRHAIGPFDLFIGMALTDTVKPEHCDVISVSSFGGFGQNSRLGKEGALNVLPIHLHDVPSLLESAVLRPDVVLVQVAGPDSDGNYSLGLVSDYLMQAIEMARVVIAEVNPRAPMTYGETLVPQERFDVLTVSEAPPIYLPGATPTAEDDAIADHIAERVQDGATIQIGIGSAPNAILSRLGSHKDIGFHSGTLTDAMADLMRSGVATGARKPFDRGLAVTGTLLGTQELYDFADRNESVSMRSVAYTHNHVVLSQIDSLVSINSAVEVDLTGQVNAEVAGSRHVGAVGGQASFVRAGAEARNGFSVIALRSTARGGTVSRISTSLGAGVVTTSRSDVDLIATEYGVAELRGVGLADRARRLIEIAHPEFRDELSRAAHDLV
ncbi:acetyl-CoA hydrolase/transferase C-terminal domain-containing protein [Citricoccus sp. NPDC055426]|uniref:acetyl-CoA hydrolase/transferase family protein n=1 Tax=Citricoccus sp. NPDC055426 TaxID=3155536 RepID=UPI00342B6BDD